MGRMYAWATPEYLLNKMSLTLILKFYLEGTEFEKQRAIQQANYIGMLFGPEKEETNETPDKAKLYERFGTIIKHPEHDDRDQ